MASSKVLFIVIVSCRWTPLVGVMLAIKKKRRNLYLLPSYVSRLLALPYQSRTATQKPTPVYAIIVPGHIPHEISCRTKDNHISTGIYRCSILDFDMKFCENFETSRISADNAFYVCQYGHDYSCPRYIPLRSTPDRSLIRKNLSQLAWSALQSAPHKVMNYFLYVQRISQK